METTLRQNGLFWLAMARGTHLRFFQAERPETFAERFFIKRRAEKEMELLQIGQKIQKSSPSSAVFDERWRQALHNFLLQHTKVDPALIDRGLHAWLGLKSRADQPHKEQVGLLFGLYTHAK
jgi:hypothetical protein